MKSILSLLLITISGFIQAQSTSDHSTFIGEFSDDYGIEYSVSDTLFIQLPNVRFDILEWNKKDQFIIARNDQNNPSEKGLYTRIDYMEFTGMEPFKWGFCLTTYGEKSAEKAKKHPAADRLVPKKGCNGYPFSRMKRR